MKTGVSDQVCRDEVSKGKKKFQILMQDYLELQKEFVSRKKKLEAANVKRGLLSAEVRFLRRRYRCLLTLQSVEAEAEVGDDTSPDLYEKPLLNERRNDNVNQSDIAKSHGGEKDFGWEAIKSRKKRKTCSINGKEMGKRKISWQDPVALRV